MGGVTDGRGHGDLLAALHDEAEDRNKQKNAHYDFMRTSKGRAKPLIFLWCRGPDLNR